MTADPDLDLCRLAFVERHVDAKSRAEALRTRLLSEMAALHTSERLRQTKGGMSKMAVLAERVRAVDALIKQYGKRRLTVDGPTAELLDQIRKGRKGDPVLRLWADDKLDDQQANNAREIGAIVYASARALDAKITRLPVKSEQYDTPENRRRSSVDHREWLALIRHWVFLPWSDRVQRDLPLVLGLCVDGRSVEDLRRAYKMDWTTALRRIRDALDLYGEIRGKYFKAGPDSTPRLPAPGSDIVKAG